MFYTSNLRLRPLCLIGFVWSEKSPPINSHAALWCWQKLSSAHYQPGQNEDTHLQLITQTNKCGLGYIWKRWGRGVGGWGVDKMKRREELHPVGFPHNPLKSSHSQSAQSQQKRGKVKPPVPFRAAGKRLNELKADIWEAHSVPSWTAEERTAKSLLHRQQDWVCMFDMRWWGHSICYNNSIMRAWLKT